MKKVLIIVLAVAAVCLAVFAAGYWLDFYFEDGRPHISKKSAGETFSDLHITGFENIDINTASTNIEVVTGEDYGFEYVAPRGRKTTWSNENGKLSITQKNRSMFLNFGFLYGRDDYIRVIVPAGAQLKTGGLRVASGNIDVSGLVFETLGIDAVSGNTSLIGTQAAQMDVSSTSGNIRLNGCKAGRLEAKVTSGNLDAEKLETEGMTVKLTSGNAALEGSFLGSSKLTAVSGDVTLVINGKKTDYNRDISVVSGNVTVDGERTGSEKYENAAAGNALEIDLTSGNVRVSFTG